MIDETLIHNLDHSIKASLELANMFGECTIDFDDEISELRKDYYANCL